MSIHWTTYLYILKTEILKLAALNIRNPKHTLFFHSNEGC